VSLRAALLLAALLAACGSGGEDPPPIPEKLSGWGLFSDGAAQVPVAGVVPYDLNAPLFSDFAAKHRFIRLPEGGQMTLAADGMFEFPVGTVLVKTFAFAHDLRDPGLGERLIETRLLVHESTGWQAYVYQWDEQATDATLTQVGARVPVSFVDESGATKDITYRVPNRVQCENCHGGVRPSHPLGPSLQQLDKVVGVTNQLDDFVGRGMLASIPAGRAPFPDPEDASADLTARARAYLHANCSHCHREGGAAQQSGLWLDRAQTDPIRIGVCKPPVAAGRGSGGRHVAIMPGSPDESIIIFRVESEEPGIKMPELPAVLSHPAGASLLREWIASMPANDCGVGD
jgi:uncharacterized repeat protein (TIGR03806 family)